MRGAAADAVDERKAAVTTYPGASVVSTLVAIPGNPCEDGARPKNAAPAPHRGRARTRAREGGHAWPEREAVTRCARGIAARGRRLLALAVLSVG